MRERETALGMGRPAFRATSADLGALFREHAPFIARSLRRLGLAKSDVDDAVQEVFVIAGRKLGFIAEGAERSFLYGTAVRVGSNLRRHERRSPIRQVEAEGPITIDRAPNAEEIASRRQARATLDAVLETMSAEAREVFTLYELEEMSTPEIASLLGIPAGTVSSRLRRAREVFDQQVRQMRKKLEEKKGCTP